MSSKWPYRDRTAEYARRKANGQCVQIGCIRPPAATNLLCEHHREVVNTNAGYRRQRRGASGRAHHSTLVKRWQRKTMNEGRCISCGKEPLETARFGAKCLAKQRKSGNASLTRVGRIPGEIKALAAEYANARPRDLEYGEK